MNNVSQNTLAERRHFELNYIDDVLQNKLDDLGLLIHEKWGWVIYRCTYDDDEAWAKFQKIVNDRSREQMARGGFPPEVANSFEWTFVSDQSLFDGASKDQLRQHFYAWATEADEPEQPRVLDSEYTVASRYQYFIQVDEEVLRATVDANPYNDHHGGWVNFVRCWHLDLDSDWREETKEHVDQEDGDEGWMRIAGDMVGPEFYEQIGASSDNWYVYYRPPPGVLEY